MKWRFDRFERKSFLPAGIWRKKNMLLSVKECRKRLMPLTWNLAVSCLDSTMMSDRTGWKLNLFALISMSRSNFIHSLIAWFNESFVFFCECLSARCGLSLINSQVLELLVFQVWGNDTLIWVRLCLNLSINHIWWGNHLAFSRTIVRHYPDFSVWQ